ncbi:MAG: ADP-ribose diphosphatase, partial [Rhodospirillaceae bacterium]|nr:ADP-ribose diphosphatase [Rhodospirillaceae bacterium]
MTGPDDPAIEIIERQTAFQGYFRIEQFALRHRTYSGGWTPEVKVELFERGNTVVVLPYDPVRDTVVLIEQFRIGAYVAG